MPTLEQIEPVNTEAVTASLKSICTLIADCPHSTPTWTDTGVLVLRSHNIRNGKLNLSSVSFTDEEHYQGRIRRAKPQEHDIVITREAPMGEVCMVPAGLKCCLGQRMVLLRPDPSKVVPRFLLYALQSPTVQAAIKSHDGTGSTVSNLRIPLLEGLKLKLLPLPEQKEAAAFLGAVDDRIENLRQTNETLEAMARAIFKSWFVDFDPVRAKAEGREPGGMDAATAALFPSEFQDSELGPMPQGWRVGSIADICKRRTENVGTSDMSADEPYVGLEHISRRSWLLSQWDQAAKVASNKSRFGKFDVLFGKLRPYFHKVSVAPVDGICSTDILVLQPMSERHYAFMLNHVSSEDLIEYATRLSNGAKMPRTSWGDVSAFRIVLPPDELLKQFNELVLPMILKIAESVSQLHSLAALRDTLLPRLISGKLRVPEAEAMLAEAL